MLNVMKSFSVLIWALGGSLQFPPLISCVCHFFSSHHIILLFVIHTLNCSYTHALSLQGVCWSSTDKGPSRGSVHDNGHIASRPRGETELCTIFKIPERSGGSKAFGLMTFTLLLKDEHRSNLNFTKSIYGHSNANIKIIVAAEHLNSLVTIWIKK